jgi:Predicted thioesterase
MFTYATAIRLKDTDATGVIYFAQMASLALEALEEAMAKSGISLQTILQSKTYLLPIVHMEADYYLPLKVGDRIEIALKVSHVGKSSFTVAYTVRKGKKEAGRVSMVHVIVSKKTEKSIPIPLEFQKFLKTL